MLDWLWDRKNFGLQNMINSALETAAPSYFNSSYYSNVKITLKLSNKHAKFKLNYKSSNDESDSAHFYEEWFEIDDLKSTGFDLEFGFKEEDYLSAEQHCHIISWSYYSSSEELDGRYGVAYSISMPFYPLSSEYPNITWPTNE